MTNSNSSSNNRSARIKTFVVAILILATIGFVDAAYLTVNHYLGTPLPCSIVNGCEKVTTSVYSVVLGVPLPLIGAVYYLALLVLSVAFLDAEKKELIAAMLGISGLGFLASLFLVYLQIFVLRSLCPYCLVSAADSTLIFILLYEGNKQKRDEA